MSMHPATTSSSTCAAESDEARFRRLAALWYEETGHLSSATRMAEHPAYQEIISMGEPVVPLLLRELTREPDHWFAALKAITGANPANPAESGRLDLLAAAWLRWGEANDK